MMGLSGEGEFVRRMLRGERVVGRTPNVGCLTAEDLGQLSALVWTPGSISTPLGFAVVQALRTRQPRFDAEAALAAVKALVTCAGHRPTSGTTGLDAWVRDAAAQVVFGLDDGEWNVVSGPLRELLSHIHEGAVDVLTVVLRSTVALDVLSLGDELSDAEAAFLCSLPSRKDRITGARAATGWVYAMDDDELTPRGADPMALLPGYLAFAERVVEQALSRVSAVQSGRVKYAADKAFSVPGSQVLRRALLAGLDQNCAWAEDAALPLFVGVSRAPDEAVKSVPSQSATVAIAKSIAERPSVRLLVGLKNELPKIRHDGMKKKIGRFLKTTERRVFENEDFLLTHDATQGIPKSLAPSVARALEALWLREAPLEFSDWERQFLRSKTLATATAALIWDFDDRGALMARTAGNRWKFTDSEGRDAAAPSGRVRLWHPLDRADAAAWRLRVVGDEISQPFNQVFRETYGASSIDAFLRPQLDIRVLQGLALSHSWNLLREGLLTRRFGQFRVDLVVDGMYPGATGSTVCSAVRFSVAPWEGEVASESVPKRVLSEILRAVDLLVSVAALALDPSDVPLSGTAQGRREVLAAMLQRIQGGWQMSDGRYVVRDGTKIHIATGRASRHGLELSADPGPANVMALPYADEVLRKVIVQMCRLATDGAD